MRKADRLACDDVKMQMKNCLPSTGTVVGDHTKVFIALAPLRRERRPSSYARVALDLQRSSC